MAVPVLRGMGDEREHLASRSPLAVESKASAVLLAGAPAEPQPVVAEEPHAAARLGVRQEQPYVERTYAEH